MNESPIVLACEDVTLGYEHKPLLEHLTLTVRAGDYLCIVGENGSGKSTLLRSLLGLLSPLAGKIDCPAQREGRLGYLPQQTPTQRDFPATVTEVVLSGFSNRRARFFYTAEERSTALMNLGNVCYAKGEYKEALGYYQKLYELNPNSYNAIVNIANTSYNMSRFIQAIEFANMAIEKRPTSVEPYIIAGNSYIELFKNDEATGFLKKAAEIAPNSDWLCNSIANLFQKMGNWKQCLHYAWKAFALKGDKISADDHINFGYLLYEAHDEKQDELVDKYLSRWEECFPENPIVRHMSCAIRNIQEVPTTDLSYVKGLFDGFAPSFDEILHELDYKVPAMIADFLKDTLKTKLFKKRRILDLGCGTGLCAEALRAYFPNEEFFGVDVSEKMLEFAGKKNVYKELYFDDIESFLEDVADPYHAVIAGDVLTYMGELKTLFRLLVKAVKANGLFCFSISKNTYNQSDYFLTPSGRFVHSIAYVRRLLKYCGFEVIRQEEMTLRREGNKEVDGYIVLAKKEIEVVFE